MARRARFEGVIAALWLAVRPRGRAVQAGGTRWDGRLCAAVIASVM